jgi:hypothetical protein
MERLTDKSEYCEWCDFDKNTCKMYENCYERKIVAKLREYEDAEEQGLLLRLPCKVGEKVWIAYRDGFVEEMTITGINTMIEHDRIYFDDGCQYTIWNKDYSDFKRWVFPTKEEAEAALEKMKGEEHETD